MDTYRILLLDDDDFILSALRRELLSKPYIGHQGLEIEAFTSPLAALARAREPDGYFDVVIADNRMPEMSGVDFLNKFAEIQPDAVRIVLSGHTERVDLMRAINEAHIDFFIAKPQHKNKFELMVVDDDPNILRALERELSESYTQGCFGLYQLNVHTFEHADAALAAAHEQQFDVVICDYAMPALNGVEFLRQIKEIQPDAVRMLISGVAAIDVLIAAVNTAGVNHFIGKPWHDYELRAAIDRALSHRELELENRYLAELLRLQAKQ
jgi:response regulator RpfG family c-di-GMP phosphodiesterase